MRPDNRGNSSKSSEKQPVCLMGAGRRYILHPDQDPSMVGLDVKAGDAIFFTENLR
jgi:hypothetical protein